MRCWTHKDCPSISLFQENTVAQFIDAAQPVLHPDELLHNYIETSAIDTIKIELIKGAECEIRLSGDGQIDSV